MQQGAGRRDPQALSEALGQRLQPVEHRCQVGLPDIAAVDHAKGQHLAGRQQVEDGAHVVAAIDRIDVQAGDRQVGGEVLVLLQLAEIGGQQQLDPAALGSWYAVLKACRQSASSSVTSSGSSICTHSTPCSASVEQASIRGQQARQQRQLVGIVLGVPMAR